MLPLTHIRELLVVDPSGGGPPLPFVAASGAVRVDDRLFVVSDEAHDLAVFDLDDPGPGRIVTAGRDALPEDPVERKAAKPDLEAVVLLPCRAGRTLPALLALGSGATPARRTALLWRLDGANEPGTPPEAVDLGPLYDALHLGELNVEGAAVAGDQLLLLQRGNGREGVNAVVSLDLGSALDEIAGGSLTARSLIGVRAHDLGEIDGVPLAFTDAAGLDDGRIVVTAAAEAGESTYDDGECVGAAVGILDPDDDSPPALHLLDPVHKVEGVVATPDGDGLDLLLVADADDPTVPSPLLRTRL